MNGAAVVRAVVVLLVLASVASGVGASVGAAGPTAVDRSVGRAPTQIDDGLAQQNNSSVRHEDPAEVDARGDTAALRAHLVGRLSGRLSGSLVSLSQGEYERARRLLGDSYTDDLEKYVDVEGETGNSEAFESAGETQQTYVEQVQQFRETQEEYEEARENGNRERARRLARNLTETAERIDETEDRLLDAYARIENTTGVSLSTETETVRELTANVTETASELAARELTATRLSLSVADPQASFLDPLVISGDLRTANGSAVANRTVTLRVGQQALSARTDETGSFTVSYRPTLIAADARAVRVAYRPADASVYLSSNGSVPIDVTQVTATVDLTVPATAGFGDRVTATGRVTADGVAVAGVPLRVRVGGVTLASGTTNASGGYALGASLPAEVDDGQRTVRVESTVSDRAVVVETVEESIEVESTATQVSVDGTAVSTTTVELSGRLTTVDGTPIPGESVDVRLNGRVVASLTTGPDGRYAGTVQVPESLAGAESVTLEAAYAPTGTNLRGSSANATLSLDVAADESGGEGGNGGDGGVGDGAFGDSLPDGVESVLTPVFATIPLPAEQVGLLAAGVIVVLAAIGAYSLTAGQDEPVTEEGPEETPVVEEPDTAEPDPVESPLDDARERVPTEPTTATQVAFATVREQIGGQYGIDDSLTHREFARAYRSAVDSETAADAADQLVDVYERAAFGPSGVSQADAETALEAAQTLLEL